MGIWKSLFIQAYDNAIIRDILVYAYPMIKSTSKANDLFFKEEQKLSDDELIEYTMKKKYNQHLDYNTWNTTIIVYVDTGSTSMYTHMFAFQHIPY